MEYHAQPVHVRPLQRQELAASKADNVRGEVPLASLRTELDKVLRVCLGADRARTVASEGIAMQALHPNTLALVSHALGLPTLSTPC